MENYILKASLNRIDPCILILKSIFALKFPQIPLRFSVTICKTVCETLLDPKEKILRRMACKSICETLPIPMDTRMEMRTN